MKIPCEECAGLFPKIALYRVRGHLLCRSCLRRQARAVPAPASGLGVQEIDAADLLDRVDRAMAVGGMIAKVLFYSLLFHWASTSPFWDAILCGVLFADVGTWILFSAIDLSSRALSAMIEFLIEVAIVVLFCSREVPAGAANHAMVFFAGMVTTALKWGYFSAGKIIEAP